MNKTFKMTLFQQSFGTFENNRKFFVLYIKQVIVTKREIYHPLTLEYSIRF